jgi:hypothetical protein
MRTTDPHLTNLYWLSFSLGGAFNIVFGGGKDFDAMTTNEAMEGCEPILVFVEGEGFTGG